MLNLGYDEVAKICLTHSFCVQNLQGYIGRFDITLEEQQEIAEALQNTVYDEYDWLIQLCDGIAGAEGVMEMEERMADVKRRYGSYPQDKWDRTLRFPVHDVAAYRMSMLSSKIWKRRLNWRAESIISAPQMTKMYMKPCVGFSRSLGGI